MIQPIVVGLPAKRIFVFVGNNKFTAGDGGKSSKPCEGKISCRTNTIADLLYRWRLKRNKSDAEPIAISSEKVEVFFVIFLKIAYLFKTPFTLARYYEVRTRFLKTPNILPFRNKIASPSHMINLIKNMDITKESMGCELEI
jgi:hypothetical protein